MPYELLHKRTENSKLFDLENGEKQLRVKMTPYHYRDANGDWQDCDCSVVNGKMEKAPYKIQLYTDKVGYYGVDPNGKTIELELENVTYKEPVVNGNTVTWEEIEPNVDFELQFNLMGIKVNRILKNPSANKGCSYRSYREEGCAGSVRHLGADATGRNTELNILEVPTARPNENRITQAWTGKIMKMNPATRKREWSNDVSYPVRIDPTSTFNIAVGADDGRGLAFSFGAVTQVLPSAPYMFAYQDGTQSKTGMWLRFTGITIPYTATINSATLKTYAVSIGLSGVSFTVSADSRQSPGNPTKGTQVTGPSNVLVTKVNDNVTWFEPSFFSNKSEYLQKDITVTSMVQTLVNNYDYYNGEMVFYTNRSSLSPALAIYGRDWGTSKDAELIINYTGGAEQSSSSSSSEEYSSSSSQSYIPSSSSSEGYSSSSSSEGYSSSSSSSSEGYSSSSSSTSSSSSEVQGEKISIASYMGRKNYSARRRLRR